MKTQNNKTGFLKQTVLELSDQHLLEVSGGSTPAIPFVISIILSYQVVDDKLDD